MAFTLFLCGWWWGFWAIGEIKWLVVLMQTNVECETDNKMVQKEYLLSFVAENEMIPAVINLQALFYALTVLTKTSTQARSVLSPMFA